MKGRIAYHFNELMTLVEVRHDDALAFGDVTLLANELAVLPHGVDLEEGELILRPASNRIYATR